MARIAFASIVVCSLAVPISSVAASNLLPDPFGGYIPPRPPVEEPSTKVLESPELPKGARIEIERTKPLQAEVKRKILKDLGIGGGVSKGPTRLSVRRPYAGSKAFLSLVGASAVNPAVGRYGTAAVGANPKQGELVYDLPMPGLPFGSTARLDNALLVDFRAKKGYDYVVECAWHGRPRPEGALARFWEPLRASDMYTTVKAGDTELTGGTAHLANVIVQAIPARKRDTRVVVAVKSSRGFLASQCTITPFLRKATTHTKRPTPTKKVPGVTPTLRK